MIRKLEYSLGMNMEIEDLPKLRNICLTHGYDCDDKDLVDAWTEFSDSYSANWLLLYEDDDITWEKIEPYILKRL